MADSDAHLDRVRLRLCRYVQNPSFDRASELLDKSRYCIIAGIPGIGKTTLAEVLLADLVDRQGFELCRITQDLSEIKHAKNSKRKQVFYFDDFLGKTDLDKLRKNEDQRIIELMEEVAANPNWRFVLTTREYILNSARFHYESFAHPPIDFKLCVVNLADYTRPIRARILYNHLYFSDLSKSHKLALLQNGGYEQILSHRNYSPRVIDYMTQARYASDVPSSRYLAEFTRSLENPSRIWDHAFRYQISEASRHALLVLSTLPDPVRLADFERAFWAFYTHRQKRFGLSTRSGDFQDALKQLDGNFVSSKAVGKDIAVSFHNPSVADFVEAFLADSDGDVIDLIKSAYFYEQYRSLWSGRRGQPYKAVRQHRNEFLQNLRNKLFGPSADTIRIVNSKGEPIGLRDDPPSNESRAQFAASLANELNDRAADHLLTEVIELLRTEWTEGRANRTDLVRLLTTLTKRGLGHEDSIFTTARNCLFREPKEIDDFTALAEFTKRYRKTVAKDQLKNAKLQFLEFAADYSDQWSTDEDPDWLRQAASDLEGIAKTLRANVSRHTDALRTRADEIEIERGASEPDEYDREDWESPSNLEDVSDMFQSLRDELEEENAPTSEQPLNEPGPEDRS